MNNESFTVYWTSFAWKFHFNFLMYLVFAVRHPFLFYRPQQVEMCSLLCLHFILLNIWGSSFKTWSTEGSYSEAYAADVFLRNKFLLWVSSQTLLFFYQLIKYTNSLKLKNVDEKKIQNWYEDLKNIDNIRHSIYTVGRERR